MDRTLLVSPYMGAYEADLYCLDKKMEDRRAGKQHGAFAVKQMPHIFEEYANSASM